VTVTNPADLVQEACDLLAQMVPRLRRETPVPDETAFAAPGMTARPAAAPVPGNPPAFFAAESIQSSARWTVDLMLYAVGAGKRDEWQEGWGGSDANTIRILTKVIPKLAAGVKLASDAGDEAYGIVLRELDARVDEARSVRAIDEAEQWRPVRARPCPFCGCFFLKVLLDAAKRPAGRIECFGHRESGAPCRATWARLADIVPDLARADAETAPDLDG
jgi:hypothetical protein